MRGAEGRAAAAGARRRRTRAPSAPTAGFPSDAFWATPLDRLWNGLRTTTGGLSARGAQQRLRTVGPNVAAQRRRGSALRLLAAQASLAVGFVTALLPYSPPTRVLGYAPLSRGLLEVVADVVLLYSARSDATKHILCRRTQP